MGAVESRLLSAEKHENHGVVWFLAGGHTRKVHHGCHPAGIVVCTGKQDTVAHGAAMVVVGGEDHHAVDDATDISHHILRLVVFVELKRYVGIDFADTFGNQGVDDFNADGIVLLRACDGCIGVELVHPYHPSAILELFGPLGFAQFVGAGQCGAWADTELGVWLQLYAVD